MIILSNQQATIASAFIVPAMHNREARRKAMSLARTEPEKVLAALPALSEEVQRDLRYLRVIAEEAMGDEVNTVPARATGRKAERNVGDLLDRYEGLLSGKAIGITLKKLHN
jgi:hypothetical protein